jgi:indolepyruvate ferredoxin oxidoreductase alpha subunit
MKKMLLTGNEAVARGAWEAGVRYASAYPGTPSTEILETLAEYKDDILAEWAPNEKVAFEAAMGGAFAGARTLAAMKHVGVNVAADPLFTMAYIGTNGGMVLITADEPGQHSSQNEQDNRQYARFAKVPLLEPSDSQESLDMMKVAYDVSEAFDTPVLLRMTTRVCHSKGIVEVGERTEVPIRPYVKDVRKYMTIPDFARKMRVKVEERTERLAEYSNESPLNFIEWHDRSVGVIASGAAYRFAREVFGEKASYLKLGFTFPLPDGRIREFCTGVEKVYVVEENDPIIEEHVRMLGFACIGKAVFPPYGELTPDVLRKALYGETLPHLDPSPENVVPRPPTLCAGCPHRGFFYELGKRKNTVVAGDIGCYTLAFAEPYNAMDYNVCMGSSISSGHGFQQVLDMVPDNRRRVVSVLGDSTFFHTGINSLLDVVYNGSRTINVILDNRITGMTGHQQNPGTGFTLQGKPAKEADIEALVRACGIEHLVSIDPNDLTAVRNAFDWAYSLDEPCVIVTRWPCVLKKFTEQDKAEFPTVFKSQCRVVEEKCIGCRMCLRTGCSSLVYDATTNKVHIDPAQCVGCGVCRQVCKPEAIVKEDRRNG